MSQSLCSPMQCNVCLVIIAHKSENVKETKGQSTLNEHLKPLSVCNGCHLIRYCGKEHQKIDWRTHAEFCKAIKKIRKAAKVDNPFLLDTEPIKQGREGVENAIVQLKFLVKQTLKRGLEYHEEELTSYPVYCGQCFTLKNISVVCPNCKHQAYCCDEHLTANQKEHQEICGFLALYYCPYKTVPNNSELFKELTLAQKISNISEIDLIEAFEIVFRKKLPENPTLSLKDYQLFSYAADFSCIGSICYALSHMDMQHFKEDNFVIFILGAALEPILWFREKHCEFFFHLYPQIRQLDLHFIGPDASYPTENLLRFRYLNCQKYVRFHHYCGLFEQYCLSYKVKPSAIVAFNCGFSEFTQYYNSKPYISNLNSLETLESNPEYLENADFTNDTWFGGLKEMLHTFDTPIIFTSFTKQEADFDFAALKAAALRQDLKISIDRIFKVTKNPFHDLRPLRQWYARDKEAIYFRNGYIQAVISKLLK